MAYTNKGNIQKLLNVDITSGFDTQITAWIAVVKKWIDRYCKKTFESVAGTKYYDGNGDRSMFFDDATSITSVEILDADGSTLSTLTEGASADYLLYPLNDTPKNEIRLQPSSGYSHFPARDNSVKITGVFGYSTTVPEDVELVASKLVASIISEGLKGGKLKRVQLGDYEADYQVVDEAAEPLGIYNILDTYRDIEL